MDKDELCVPGTFYTNKCAKHDSAYIDTVYGLLRMSDLDRAECCMVPADQRTWEAVEKLRDAAARKKVSDAADNALGYAGPILDTSENSKGGVR